MLKDWINWSSPLLRRYREHGRTPQQPAGAIANHTVDIGELPGNDHEGAAAAKPKQPGLELARATKFSFNTDGSDHGKLSGSHQGSTASGIGNGGEILGYTIPLDRTLKRIKRDRKGNLVAGIRQAAILTFSCGSNTKKVLAVGNDTGGRHVAGDSLNRSWGELGINTWKAVQSTFGIEIGKNSLNTPASLVLDYEFLPDRIRTRDEYRKLKKRLKAEKRL